MMSQSTLGKILPGTQTTFKPFLLTLSLILRPDLFTFDFLALCPMCFEMSLQFLLSGECPVTTDTEVMSLVDLSPVPDLSNPSVPTSGPRPHEWCPRYRRRWRRLAVQGQG